jgi:hypothetical protein
MMMRDYSMCQNQPDGKKKQQGYVMSSVQQFLYLETKIGKGLLITSVR